MGQNVCTKMLSPSPETQHFTRAVTELASKRTVITTRAIFNDQGIKIVEKGVAVQPNLYARLMQHHLSAPLEDSVSSPNCVSAATLRERLLAALERVPLYARMAAPASTRTLLLETMGRIPLPEAIAFQLTVASEMHPHLLDDLVETALVAAWLAIDPVRTSHARVLQAATVGVLHDIGMLHLHPALLDPHQPLDDAQRRQLYSHPLVSHILAQNQSAYPAEVLQGIADHHEFLDGSGYPRGLTDAQIGPLARILALAEVVVHAHAPGRIVSAQRLSVMLRMNMHRYDETLAKRVLELLRMELDSDTDQPLLPLASNPVHHLLAIDAALNHWPASLPSAHDWLQQRRKDFEAVSGQLQRLRFNLAQVGAAPDQLAQLGEDELDQGLQVELTLLVDEAAWQMRALARQCLHRCSTPTKGTAPPELGAWLQAVDSALVGIVQSRERDRETELESD
jgi:response regulator RpfG family c-di-GMP phosphodiesterase